MIFTMAIFNVIGLYFLMPKVKELLRDYDARLAAGEFPNVRRLRAATSGAD
jgi:AGCS family alanine or glycine:cation symporter